MDKLDILDKQRFIFGSLFLIPNKLQVIMDRGLADDDITTKQWFLMVVIDEFFDTPPTLSEVAEAMGSSRQNVKQIALKLQKKGFLAMKKDPQDSRAIRLSLTEKCHYFWEKRQGVDSSFLNELFMDLNEDEINILSYGLKKLFDKITDANSFDQKGEI